MRLTKFRLPSPWRRAIYRIHGKYRPVLFRSYHDDGVYKYQILSEFGYQNVRPVKFFREALFERNPYYFKSPDVDGRKGIGVKFHYSKFEQLERFVGTIYQPKPF